MNDPVFLDKYTTFITEFGKKYNDASVVDYVDAIGIGWWGEVHNIHREIFRPLDESSISILTISSHILSAIFQPNHLLFHYTYQPLVKNIDEIMNIKSVNSSLDTITKAYRNSFDEVLLSAQQGGAKDNYSEMLIILNISCNDNI